MGTVGLSFGSPTSGAGFDVSTTVASIVGNLQNIETPWKTQLTSLQAQDTAISSLGTLMSNLSNDLSQLTDFTGIMAQKTGSSSDTNVLQLTAATSSAVAGTHTVVVNNLALTSSGYLNPISKSTDTLSGSITLQAGSGTAQTITLDSTNNTLSGLAKTINSSGVGITASVLTDSAGSRLSLVSGTAGASGNITISANSIVDSSSLNSALGYNKTVTGKDASMTVDGVDLTSSSNTVSNLIPGLTFQLLAPSTKEPDGTLEQVQVIIGNDNSAVESTIKALVSDYNALVSATSTQDGMDSSGNPEPLFGSPTLSLLQQQLLSGLNMQNPNGNLDAVGANTGTTLTGSLSIKVAGGFALNYDGAAVTGSEASSGTLTSIANAGDTLAGSISIQVGTGTTQTVNVPTTLGDNTLAGLASAINTASIGVTASVVTNSDRSSSLSLLSGTSGTDGTLTVGSSIKDTSVQTIKVPTTSGDNTLAGLASAINSANIGVSATIVTKGTQSTLSLLSQTAGSNGALTVTSTIAATSEALLGYSGTSATSTTAATGTLSSISSACNMLAGSISIKVGTGAAQTVNVDPANATLSGLADAINNAGIGVTASLSTDGKKLSLLSGTVGTTGNLTVTSNILDTTDTTVTNVNYANSSDLSGLSSLGITVSKKADGTLTF